MNICVFGASSSRLEDVYYAEAEAVGRLLAEERHSIVFGGGADGLMGACARGAKAVGGRVIGVAPRLFDEPGFLLPECDELILTETMAARKEKMLALSDAFLALPGGIGTMDELFEVITLRQLGLAEGSIVLFNTNGFYAPLVSFLEGMADKGFMSEACLKLLRICNTPREALDALQVSDSPRGSIRRLSDYCK